MIELPTIEINGELRTLRRWGLSDVFRLQKVLNDFNTGAALRGITLDLENPDFQSSLLGYIAAGLTFSESSLTEWIHSWYEPVIGKDEEIYLPDLVKTLELLVEHPDITRFLANVSGLANSLSKKAKQPASRKG